MDIKMRQLSNSEIHSVTGGNPAALGVGILGAYIYESVGGKEGIDNYFENSYASARGSFRYWGRRLRRTFDLRRSSK